MNTQELKTKLQKPYNREEWLTVAKDIFKNVSILSKPLPIGNGKDFVKSFQQLGFVNLQDGRNLAIIEVKVDDTKKLSSNKVELRNLTSKLIDEHTTNGVLVIYDNDMDGNYRFSFVTKETEINEETGKLETRETSAKRFTYLLGPGESCSTAAMQLSQVAEKDGHAEMKDVIKAFNVEKVNKEFFNGYKKQYEAFTTHLINTSIRASVFNGDEKAIRDFAKKMMGRIVFIYFLQKKGWMGVPESEASWANGDPDFLCNLFNDAGKGEDFYAVWLSNIFFNCLNTERPGQLFKLPKGNKAKVPYLNGGLFEKENSKTDLITFPSALFQNLFDFLSQYNFTIYEDDPEERFLAVDPEMLGHIFENLLEDNKDKGAYYTPKEIVHYMCRESLIEYLYTKLNPTTTESFKEIGKSQTDLFGNKEKKQLSLEQSFGTTKELVKREAIEKMVLHHEAAEIINYEKEILKALYEVKICDPAIGSGAFPMGLLTEIFQLIETLHNITPDVTAEVWKLGDTWNPAIVKKQIIQNSIYGVDIEKGAVDIARLRFWLSLIIDEDMPKPLPNLDYKIVVGNSLLSKFEEEVIDIDWNMSMAKAVGITKDIIKEQESKLYALHYRQDLYFNQTTGNKKKLQEEIRDIKIDILTNQLILSKISFTEKNPKLGGALPTSKEIQKNLENQIVEKGFDITIQKLNIIKKDKKLPFNFFDWKLDFAEIMNEKVAKRNVGFDIVIANPPYVNAMDLKRIISEDDHKKLKQKFSTAKGTVDLYIYFFECGILLLKKRGNLAYISPNRYLSASYGEALREFIFKNERIISIVDYSDIKVFKGASTYPVLTFLSNENNFENYEIKIGKYIENQGRHKFKICYSEKLSLITGLIWGFLLNEKIGITEKVMNQSIMSNEYCKINATSTTAEADSLHDYINEQDGKKLINTGTIDRYVSLWGKELMTDKGIRYLKPYLNIDSSMISINRRNLYNSPKIIFAKIALRAEAFLDLNGTFASINTNCLHSFKNSNSLQYVLAWANSKLFQYCFECFFEGLKMSGGYLLYSAPNLSVLFIKSIPNTKMNQFNKKVELLLEEKFKKNDFQVAIIDRQIDVLFYSLYELTYEEACTVEGSDDWMGKEEYERFTVE